MQTMRRYGFHHGIAAVACSLLIIFAVGAKVAMYHTSDVSAKPIASAKMWQTSKAAPSEDEKATAPTQPIILLLLLLSLPVMEGMLLRGHYTPLRQLAYPVFPPLAVRPPPTH